MKVIITKIKAQEIAEKEIERIAIMPKFSKYAFQNVEFVREDDVSWTFGAESPQLQREGYVPGAVFVRVDKRDGHVWTREETEKYFLVLAKSKDSLQDAA
jgi:hypothetical protein